MTNEELLDRLSAGDEPALAELCEENKGLIRDRAFYIAQKYSCVRYNDMGQQTAYTKEMLSELESVGMLAFIECLRSGRYNREQGRLSTYAVPLIDGAMRRYLEINLGTLSLSKDSMTLVRKAQRLYHEYRESLSEIAKKLDITEQEAERHILYPTHFFSVHDLQDSDDSNDIFDIVKNDSVLPPDRIIYKRIRMEYLEEMFHMLYKKDRDILGKCYGVFGYPKTPLREIAMYHMMKEDAVEKAKSRILKKLRAAYPTSRMRQWDTVNHVLNHMTGQI